MPTVVSPLASVFAGDRPGARELRNDDQPVRRAFAPAGGYSPSSPQCIRRDADRQRTNLQDRRSEIAKTAVVADTSIHPRAWKGCYRKFAIASNAPPTAKITHLGDTPMPCLLDTREASKQGRGHYSPTPLRGKERRERLR